MDSTLFFFFLSRSIPEWILPVIDVILRAVEAESLVGIDIRDGGGCLFEIQLRKDTSRVDGIGIIWLEMDDRLSLVDDFNAAENVQKIVQHSGTGIVQFDCFRLPVGFY